MENAVKRIGVLDRRRRRAGHERRGIRAVVRSA